MKQQIQNTKQIQPNKKQNGAGEHCNSNITSIVQHTSQVKRKTETNEKNKNAPL
jgi:hypothetical protein